MRAALIPQYTALWTGQLLPPLRKLQLQPPLLPRLLLQPQSVGCHHGRTSAASSASDAPPQQDQSDSLGP